MNKPRASAEPPVPTGKRVPSPSAQAAAAPPMGTPRFASLSALLAECETRLKSMQDATTRKLAQRWFLTRNVHQSPSITLVQPRWALSYMRGQVTLGDIKRALAHQTSP